MYRIYKNILTLLLLLSVISLNGQERRVKFAYFADTHIALGSNRVEILESCIEDLNKQNDIEFAVFAGDITEFGSDKEIALAKSIIDELNIPSYVFAGNHDAKWSESGCNTFAKVMGYEYKEWECGGIKFLGCNSGPNMRMAPALIPRETIVWLDSIAKAIPAEQPVIFVNHYPQDSTVLNYFQVVDILKQTNIQLIMGGHYHNNMKMNYSGIPGMIGRAPDPNNKRETGYNIVTIENGQITIQEKYINKPPKSAWFTLAMSEKPRFNEGPVTPKSAPDGNDYQALNDYYSIPDDFVWMTFDKNENAPEIKALWRVHDDSDVGCGASIHKNYVVYANTAGDIKALNAKSGELIWKYSTGNKIFSTPAIASNRVIVGCSDGNIYCLSLKKGELLWKYKCDKSVLGAPTIYKGVAYIGSSDGEFRALDIKSGTLKWRFNQVKGFVESKPFVDDTQVVFGDWANTLYSLDTKSGKLQWKWNVKGSRMFSPAAVYPVKANGKIFIVTPTRHMYVIDAATGAELYKTEGGRESIGISDDLQTVYVKTMFNTLQSWSTVGNTPNQNWEINTGLEYDIAPTPSVYCTFDKDDPWILVPTDKGVFFSFDADDADFNFKYKVGVALVNSIVPCSDNRLLISTMEGVITMLQYTPQED